MKYVAGKVPLNKQKQYKEPDTKQWH